MILDQLRQFPVKERQHLVKHLHDRDLDSGELQRFTRLDADQASPDNDRLGNLVFLCDLLQPIGILQALQRRDPLQVDSGKLREDRVRTGRQDLPPPVGRTVTFFA